MKTKLDKTELEIIEFGDEPEDHFYCLVDSVKNPNGLNVEKLKLSDPRNFDDELRRNGCFLMFTGDEITELINRGDVKQEQLHQSLYELAVKEKIISED